MVTLLGMFAKYWTPGAVKTRLAAKLGPQRAASVHRLFVETLTNRFSAAADERELVFAPPDAEVAFRRLVGDAWRVTPQAEGDLGARMQRFFEDALARAERVVLIGSDSPDLPAEYLKEALDVLKSHEAVLGPAADGGYYLVGSARRMPPIFDGIAWSTGDVWPQTVAHLQASGTSWHELPPWYDVDDEQGLSALLRRLDTGRQRDPHLATLHDQLKGLLSGGPAV